MDIEKLKQMGMVADEPGAVQDVAPIRRVPYVPKNKEEDGIIQMLKALAVHNRPMAEKLWRRYKNNPQKPVDKPA